MTPLAIAHLTVLDVPPQALVRLAADTGYDAVTLQISPPELSRGPTYVLEPGGAALRALRATLDASGVSVLDVQVIRLGPLFDARRYESMLQVAAELGAGHAVVVCDDRDMARAAGSLAALAALARPMGLQLSLEYMVYSGVPSLQAALALIHAAGADNVVLLVDTLHHHRSGGAAADLGSLPPRLVPYVQVCDAPRMPPEGSDGLEDLRAEALTDRLVPGDGGLPLGAMLAAVPAGAPWVLEVPLKSRTVFGSDRALLEYARRRMVSLMPRPGA